MPSYLKKSDFEAIILYKLYQVANSDGRARAVAEIAGLFTEELPTQRVRLAVDALYVDDYIDYNSTGSSTLYRIVNKGLSRVESLLDKEDSILNRYVDEGDFWVASTLGGFAPAAGRVVTFNHNQPPASEIISDLEGLREAIRSDNEASVALGDDKEAALAEINSLKTLVESDAIRPSTFVASSKKTLNWIAEKGIGTIIAELAKIALKHIMAWLF